MSGLHYVPWNSQDNSLRLEPAKAYYTYIPGKDGDDAKLASALALIGASSHRMQGLLALLKCYIQKLTTIRNVAMIQNLAHSDDLEHNDDPAVVLRIAQNKEVTGAEY